MKLIALSALVLLATFLVGCGDPAPSTPIAPDVPSTSAKSNGTPSDLSSIKASEHDSVPADRK